MLHLTETISSDYLDKHYQTFMIWPLYMKKWSVDFKTIYKVLCVAMTFACDVMELTELWCHCLRRQWLGRAHYTDYYVLFCLIFSIILYSILQNRLRMVARALWRSEALRVVHWPLPWTSPRIVQGLRPRHSPACLWSPQCMAYHGFAMREVSVNSTSLYETN